MQGHQILNLLFLPICLKKTILIKLVTQSQFVNSYFLYYNHFYVRIVCLFTLVANGWGCAQWGSSGLASLSPDKDAQCE